MFESSQSKLSIVRLFSPLQEHGWMLMVRRDTFPIGRIPQRLPYHWPNHSLARIFATTAHDFFLDVNPWRTDVFQL